MGNDKPKWSYKIQIKTPPNAEALLGSAWEVDSSYAFGTSTIETKEEVEAGLPGAYEDFIAIMWVCPFGEEPEPMD